jgi:hypothetical protein
MSTSKIYFGSNSNAIYGSAGSDPRLEYQDFVEQARMAMHKIPGSTAHDGYSRAHYRLVFRCERPNCKEPDAPPTTAKSHIFRLYERVIKKYEERTAAVRKFVDEILLDAMDPAIRHVVCEYSNGVNLGTANRDDQDVLDLLEAKYGIADAKMLRALKVQATLAFDPTKTSFEAYLMASKVASNALQKHGQPLSAHEQYEALKGAVAHLPSFTVPVQHFEMDHFRPEDLTFDTLGVHLLRFADANSDTIAMSHAINQVAHTAKPKTAVKSANADISVVTEALRAAIGTQELTATQVAALAREMKHALARALSPKPQLPAGSCKHHPFSTTHTTEMCKQPRAMK